MELLLWKGRSGVRDRTISRYLACSERGRREAAESPFTWRLTIGFAVLLRSRNTTESLIYSPSFFIGISSGKLFRQLRMYHLVFKLPLGKSCRPQGARFDPDDGNRFRGVLKSQPGAGHDWTRQQSFGGSWTIVPSWLEEISAMTFRFRKPSSPAVECYLAYANMLWHRWLRAKTNCRTL